MTASPPAAAVVPQSRWACVVRAGYGAALVCMPGKLIAARTGRRPSRRVRTVARLLGVRHLTQALLCAAAPTRWLIRAGSAADVLHAASMLALAAEDPWLQPAALTDAGIATGFAAAGAAFLRLRPRSQRH
jgi:hypothetical protein